eukprot:scaffold5221_cov51-Cyclotella_meneghiniana.AAC.2
MGKNVAGSIDYTTSEGGEPLVESKAKKKSANKDHLFPGKLYDLLCDPDSEGIIGWMDHGRSWKILDRKRLGAMLERYFKHDHVESFIRSANGWGFKRIKSDDPYDPDKNSYYHPYFLRGLRVLYQSVDCQCHYKNGQVLRLPYKPNLSKLAESNPLPLDGVRRSLNEALAYVHVPPPPPTASNSRSKSPKNHVLQNPLKSTDANEAMMPSRVHQDAASFVTPLNRMVHGQHPSMSSYADKGAVPSFMMHHNQPLSTNTHVATMTSYPPLVLPPLLNAVQGAANIMMHPQQGQPVLSTNAYGATVPNYFNHMTCTPSEAIKDTVAMMPHHMQEQLLWQTQCHLLNAVMISGVDPRVPSHHHPHQEPTAPLLTASHRVDETPPFNPTPPKLVEYEVFECKKSFSTPFKAGNHATGLSSLGHNDLRDSCTTMISCVDPRFLSYHHPHQEPTTSLLTAGHQGNETSPFNQTPPKRVKYTVFEHEKSLSVPFKAGNYATRLSRLGNNDLGDFGDDDCSMGSLDGLSTLSDTDLENASIWADDFSLGVLDGQHSLGDTDLDEASSWGREGGYKSIT